MIAAQITTPNTAKIIDEPRPTVSDHEVLIEVKNAGICGTDLHIWHGSYELAQYPVVPGHEFSGTVAEVGAAVQNFKVGDRVTADPNLPCGHCVFCQRREFNQCLNLSVVGVTRSGGFARYVSVPESAVYSIGSIPFEEAALIEPLACVVWGLKQVSIQPGDNVLIFGAGPMGVLMMQAVQRAGAASVVIIDKAPWRLELARSLGASVALNADELTTESFAELAPHGFDVVADATGVPAVIEQMFSFVRPMGKVWVFGVAAGDARVPFSPYEVFRKDLKIIGSFALNKTFHESIALLQAGAVAVKPLISHRVPLAEFAEGMDVAGHDAKRMKVQFVLD